MRSARSGTEEFLTFWVHGKSLGSVPGKMVKVPALEALFMMVKVGRRPETLPWDFKGVFQDKTTLFIMSNCKSSFLHYVCISSIAKETKRAPMSVSSQGAISLSRTELLVALRSRLSPSGLYDLSKEFEWFLILGETNSTLSAAQALLQPMRLNSYNPELRVNNDVNRLRKDAAAAQAAREMLETLPLKTYSNTIGRLNLHKTLYPELVPYEGQCIERQKLGLDESDEDGMAFKRTLLDALLPAMEKQRQIILERRRKGEEVQRQIKAKQAQQLVDAKTGRYQHPGKLVTRKADLSGLDSVELRYVESEYVVWDCCGKERGARGCRDTHTGA